MLPGAACADASNGKNNHKRLTKRIRYASVKKKNRNAAKDMPCCMTVRVQHNDGPGIIRASLALLDKCQRLMGHWQGPISLER
jgi:hypothetical protein